MCTRMWPDLLGTVFGPSCFMRPSEWVRGGGGGAGARGGGTCSLFPSKKWHCSLVPPKRNLDFLCSLFPKIACVPLFPLFLGLCSPVPLKKLPLFSFPQNPWEGLFCGLSILLYSQKANTSKFATIWHQRYKLTCKYSNIKPHINKLLSVQKF